MPSAQDIASHGRIGKVSALTIGSMGRLRGAFRFVEDFGLKVIELVSQVSTAIGLKSEVNQ
jgi:hypothetical protein